MKIKLSVTVDQLDMLKRSLDDYVVNRRNSIPDYTQVSDRDLEDLDAELQDITKLKEYLVQCDRRAC